MFFTSGSYTSYIQFDGEIYWKYTDEFETPTLRSKEFEAVKLPSDVGEWNVKDMMDQCQYDNVDL